MESHGVELTDYSALVGGPNSPWQSGGPFGAPDPQVHQGQVPRTHKWADLVVHFLIQQVCLHIQGYRQQQLDKASKHFCVEFFSFPPFSGLIL